MTNLVIMVGPVASGKSTLANNIKNVYERNGQKTIIVSSDQIRVDLYGDINDQTHNDEVFKEVRRRINNCIGKMNVIVDATSINVKSRIPLLDLVRKNSDVRKIAMVMTTPLEQAKAQNHSRDRVVPDWVLEKQAKQFEVPFYEEARGRIQ